MWTLKPMDKLGEAVGSPVLSTAAGSCRCIRLPAAEKEVAAEEEVATEEEVAAEEELAAVLVPSWEEASTLAGSTRTAGVAGWPVS